MPSRTMWSLILRNSTIMPELRLPIVALTAMLSAACARGVTEGEDLSRYVVVSGACGRLFFVEDLGADSAAALTVVAARKDQQYGAGTTALEPFALGVVDKQGNVPPERFYGILVKGAQSGTMLHSVVEVISTIGDLYRLSWCPD